MRCTSPCVVLLSPTVRRYCCRDVVQVYPNIFSKRFKAFLQYADDYLLFSLTRNEYVGYRFLAYKVTRQLRVAEFPIILVSNHGLDGWRYLQTVRAVWKVYPLVAVVLALQEVHPTGQAAA